MPLGVSEITGGSKLLAVWNQVCKLMLNGGLGIPDVSVQNDALLLEFLHKFYNKFDIPLVKLVWNHCDIVPHAVRPTGSFCWKGTSSGFLTSSS
jgi:hypothetical protein